MAKGESMKKLFWVVVLSGLCLGLNAQSMNFNLNFGVATDDSFSFSPLILSGGAGLDFHIGSALMLSPEATFYTNSRFESESFVLYPAVILNFTAGPLFVGGGVAEGFALTSGGGHTDLLLKINAGLRTGSIKLTAYIMTAFDALFQTGMLVGATIGFGF
jgi:hypothetical protein